MTTPGDLTPRGYPTPSAAAIVRDGYQAITDLADAVDTDMGNHVDRHLAMFILTGNTDANGELRLNHGLGYTPNGVVATLRSTTAAILNLIKYDARVDATQIIVRALRTDTGAAFAGQGITYAAIVD